MNQEKTKLLFKQIETGYHRSAKEILAAWVNGIQEYKLMHKDSIVIVPDVVCIENGVIIFAYEVTHSNKLTGKKLAMYDYWCYMNRCSLTLFEVSADYILAQTEKPSYISADCYIIDPNNYESCTL